MYPFVSLRENKDFRRAYSKGIPYVSPVVVTYVLKNRRHMVRAGITAGKKTGGAVKRSRARRVIREAFRRLAPRVKEGYDFVFVARTRTPFVKSTYMLRVLEKQLGEAGVFK